MERMTHNVSRRNALKFLGAAGGGLALVSWAHGGWAVAEAVAALYAYESQVPEIATTKIDGLRKFYGVTQPEGLAYFEVHEEADKAHRAAWRGWLEEHADGNEEDILATTHEALDALWGALDAVHCERQEVRM